jgi:GAF domain-containing protein
VISGSPSDIRPVFDTIVANAVRLCGARMGAVFRFDGKLVHLVAHHNYTPEVLEVLHRTHPRPPQLDQASGRAILTRTVAQIEDALADPNYHHEMAHAGKWRSLLAVPMLRDGAPIGAIVITRNEAGPFTASHIELLNTFASQAVIAIENARLLNELQLRTTELSESLEQQTATSEVLGVISSSPGDLEPVFQAMLGNATRLCEASYGALWLCDGDAFRCVAIHGALPEPFAAVQRGGVFRPGPEIALARVAKTRQTVQIADLRTGQGYLDREPLAVAAVELAGIRTLMAVPMLKENELVGVISIYRREVRQFTDKQVALVTSFAAQAVIAIDNGRLLSELRQSLEQQTATGDVLKVISRSTFDLPTVLDTLAESAAGTLRRRQSGHLAAEGHDLSCGRGVARLTQAKGIRGEACP